jgi:DNA replication protein DnaC
LVELPIIGGPDKGKIQIFRYGCKCEEMKLAQEALEARERAKKQYALDMFNAKSLINEKLKAATLKNYETKNNESLQNALEWAVDYCKTFNTRENKKAILAGKSGLGKSHLSVGVTKYLMKHGTTCIFISVPKLFTRIKSTWEKESTVRELELLEALETVDLLVLDDIGIEGASQWQVTKLFEIIDSREGKHTIFTTNLATKKLIDELGKRNFERLFYEADEIFFQGESHRLKNRRR